MVNYTKQSTALLEIARTNGDVIPLHRLPSPCALLARDVERALAISVGAPRMSDSLSGIGQPFERLPTNAAKCSLVSVDLGR
jgi:hypothetical protein